MRHCVFLSLLIAECVLSARPGLFNQRSMEGQDIVLFCNSKESVSWDKRSVGGRIQVFIVQDEKDTIVCKRDSDEWSVLADSSLLIKKASVSDSGIYFCNDSPLVNLTIMPSQVSSESSTNTQPSTTTTGGVSEVERGLMFGGVALAFLSFLSATVAAGRVILHQAWQAGRDSVLHCSE